MARRNSGKSRKFEVVISPELDALLQDHMQEHGIKTAAAAGRMAVAQMVGRPDLAQGITPGRPPKQQPDEPAAAGGAKKAGRKPAAAAKKKTTRKKS